MNENMKAIVEKLKELETLVKETKGVISLDVRDGKGSILVNGFEYVPNEDVGYRKLKTDSFLKYEKFTEVDGVKISTYGSKADMVKEFTEVA